MRERDFMKGEAQNYETIRGTEKKKKKGPYSGEYKHILQHTKSNISRRNALIVLAQTEL